MFDLMNIKNSVIHSYVDDSAATAGRQRGDSSATELSRCCNETFYQMSLHCRRAVSELSLSLATLCLGTVGTITKN